MSERFMPKVGDLVKIRQFDDMVSEFGIITGSRFDYIRTSTTVFSETMKNLCGLEFVISGIEEIYKGYRLRGHDTGYIIDADMVEPIEKEDEEFDEEGISLFLNEVVVSEK